MSQEKSLKTLRKELMSPRVNPYAQAPSVTLKRGKKIVARTDQPLVDLNSGEITHVKTIHKIEELDEEHFVKVFAAGITAAYDLSKTGQKVFQLVLDQYQKAPMTGGFADCVELYWFGDGIEGQDVGMSERTFLRGIKELLQNAFLHPRNSSSYWVNPALFWKGSRVLFVKEYRMKTTSEPPKQKQTQIEQRDPHTVDFINGLPDKELAGIEE